MTRVNICNVFILIYIFANALRFIMDHILRYLDHRSRAKGDATVPAALKAHDEEGRFTSEKLNLIATYSDSKYHLWMASAAVSLAVEMALVLSGVIPALFNIICRYSLYPTTFLSTFCCMFFLIVATSVIEGVFEIPFDIYGEFCIEKKYGFSNMTARLFIADFFKELVMSLIMGAIYIAAITAMLCLFPKMWWLFVAAVAVGFVLLLQLLYPLVLAPLFNKFTPLEAGELKTAIEQVMEKAGFECKGIFVADTSKRSSHSNAYFTGIGRSKRVVLYDTLIKQLSSKELVAVLAHEFGHYKLGHITKKLAISIPLVFVATFALYKLTHILCLYTGFGFSFSSEQLVNVQFLGFILLGYVTSPLGFFLKPLTNHFSRKDEYQADAFAKKIMGTGEPLITSLIKLNTENLGKVITAPLFSLWFDSHPTLAERVKALEKTSE